MYGCHLLGLLFNVSFAFSWGMNEEYEEDKLIISMFTGYLYSEILILLFRNIFI